MKNKNQLYFCRLNSNYFNRVLNSDLFNLFDINEIFKLDFSNLPFLDIKKSDPPELLYEKLRTSKKLVMMKIIYAELCEQSSFNEILLFLSDFADKCINICNDYYYEKLIKIYGMPLDSEGNQQKLHVVGMGKLGGKELNPSSDIDLIFLFPSNGKTNGKVKLSNHEFFLILIKKLNDSISKINRNGFVFRVDTRIRPFGRLGPEIMNFKELKNYFLKNSEPWDRLSWIKARLICGDKTDEFDELVSPFVFRKYIDFSIVEDLRDLHFDAQKKIGFMEKYRNIKYGIGGIREIEFIIQAIQLVRGGSHPRLRDKNSISTLKKIQKMKLLDYEDVNKLIKSYVFLRNIEHRLMYIDDEQNQTLPLFFNKEKISNGMKFSKYKMFENELRKIQTFVNYCFRSAFWSKIEDNESDKIISGLTKSKKGESDFIFKNIDSENRKFIVQKIKDYSTDLKFRKLTKKNKIIINKIIPKFVVECSKLENPVEIFSRCILFLKNTSKIQSYLTLLSNRTNAISKVVNLALLSKWGLEFLSEYPALLDEFTEKKSDSKFEWHKIKLDNQEELRLISNDIESKFNFLRYFKNIYTFRLLNLDLQDKLSLQKISDHLSDLASCILEIVLDESIKELNLSLENTKFIIVGFGKLGSKELGYSSDLDLIFLYKNQNSFDEKNYSKLAKRICFWLRTRTISGSLYDVDLDLRPNGSSGLLVSSFDAYQNYISKDAMAWEHLALTRARAIAGDKLLIDEFNFLREKVLKKGYHELNLRREIVPMRQRMIKNSKKRKGFFDIKFGYGGLVDIEFCVQFLILKYSKKINSMIKNVGIVELLQVCAQNNVIPNEFSTQIQNIYIKYRKLLHKLRLSGNEGSLVNSHLISEDINLVIKFSILVLGDPNNDPDLIGY